MDYPLTKLNEYLTTLQNPAPACSVLEVHFVSSRSVPISQEEHFFFADSGDGNSIS